MSFSPSVNGWTKKTEGQIERHAGNTNIKLNKKDTFRAKCNNYTAYYVVITI